MGQLNFGFRISDFESSQAGDELRSASGALSSAVLRPHFAKAALFIFSIGAAKKYSGAVCLASRPAVAAKTALIARSPLIIPPVSSAKIYYL